MRHGHQKRPSAIKKGRQPSKKVVGRHKRPSTVKKGREGSQGRLVRAADIKKGHRLSKKGRRLSKKALKAATDV